MSYQYLPSLLALIQIRSPLQADVQAVADFLRTPDATLSSLGVEPAHGKFTGLESKQWTSLRRCLNSEHADDNDALVIFRAMTVHLAGCPMRNCAPLMKDALRRPWGLRAIEAVPEFFRMTRSIEDNGGLYPGDRHAANAFQVLALAGNGFDMSFEDTQRTIRALKAIDVQDTRHPYDGSVSLHTAAARVKNSEALAAFVTEFPQCLEARDRGQCTPLFHAVNSMYPANVKVLLAAGANPRPLNSKNETPMDCASANNRLDAVMFLMDSGAYSDDDVIGSVSRFDHFEDVDRLRAYYAAVKAQQTLNADHADVSVPPRPL